MKTGRPRSQTPMEDLHIKVPREVKREFEKHLSDPGGEIPRGRLSEVVTSLLRQYNKARTSRNEERARDPEARNPQRFTGRGKFET